MTISAKPVENVNEPIDLVPDMFLPPIPHLRKHASACARSQTAAGQLEDAKTPS
jgi:hypothetical protein